MSAATEATTTKPLAGHTVSHAYCLRCLSPVAACGYRRAERPTRGPEAPTQTHCVVCVGMLRTPAPCDCHREPPLT